MDASAQAQKATLRQYLRTALAALSPAERQSASAQIIDRLQEQSVWRQARAVLFYAARPDEPDLWPLLMQALQQGKTVLLPRFVATTGDYHAARIARPAQDVAPGKFGILEPVAQCPEFPLNQLDLVLAPGLGFDLSGRRLGRGKGYYDRLLARVQGILCGVTMDWQVVPVIPAEPHDRVFDRIVTPSRWLVCSRGAE